MAALLAGLDRGHVVVGAHAAREVDAAMQAFAADPLVVDQDETFEGTEQVRHFLTDAGTEFTYTSELVGARRTDDTHWAAVIHLEGEFDVDGIEAYFAECVAAGATVVKPLAPTAWGTLDFYLEDPDGNVIAFGGRPAGP